MNCRMCNKVLENELDDFEIETCNCIFHLCLECNSEIESMIEDKLKSNGDKNVSN